MHARTCRDHGRGVVKHVREADVGGEHMGKPG